MISVCYGWTPDFQKELLHQRFRKPLRLTTAVTFMANPFNRFANNLPASPIPTIQAVDPVIS
jgi:hypothetical protein